MISLLRRTRTFRLPAAGRAASLGASAALVAFVITACSSPAPTSALSPSVVGSSTASKPGTVTPATMTFADAAGDAITSDGSGAYPTYNGTTGCELLSGSLTCILQGSSRSLNYNLNGLISGSGPTGTLSDHTNFAVNGVGSLAIGSSTTAQGLFHTANGQFNFHSAGDSNTDNVFVTRVDAHTWAVSTSAGDIANLVQTVPDPNNPHKTITVVSYYHLPFGFTAVTQ